MAIRRVSLLAALAVLTTSSAATAQVIFSEDFESVTLKQVVDETLSVPDPCTSDPSFSLGCWSDTGPAGWTVDNSAMPPDGVREWRGWNWADPVWWDQVSGQGRGNFSFDGGFVTLIADSDEWDDDPHPEGIFDSTITSPPIDISGVSANGATLQFSSSWRAEPDQEAFIMASFDGGAPVEVLHWQSTEFLDDGVTPNPLFHPDGNPEVVQVPLNNPGGTSNVQLSFRYTGDNNWWWAIDNLEVTGGFFENWEGVTLGPNVDENLLNEDELPPGVTLDDVRNGIMWTDVPPDGWSVDRSQVPGVGDPNEGVTEWEGWSFAQKDLWTLVAGDQNRSFFTKGQNVVAVADPDEWDDLGDPEALGPYNTDLDSPPIDISGQAADSLQLTFDSSWRPEDNQKVSLEVSFDGGAPIELLRWTSDPNDPDFHGDAENETITLDLPNPEGASSMVITWKMFDAGNDWWWAIDNIEVAAASSAITGDMDGDGDVDFDDIAAFVLGLNEPATYEATFGRPPEESGDTDGDGDIDFDDIGGFVDLLSTGGLQSVPEPASALLVVLGGLSLLLLRRRRTA